MLAGQQQCVRPHAGPSRHCSHHVAPRRVFSSAGDRRQVQQCAATPLKDVLELLISRQELSEQQAQDTMHGILQDFSPEQAAAFLVLLRAKGETPAEVAGLAKALMSEALQVQHDHRVVDIVGTGGDGIGSVNISTGACVIAAAAGAYVAKHGNRSVSSLCGSADVLEALGVAIDLGPAGVQRCIDEAGVGFMYAPRYHPAMKRIRGVRSALKIRTIFNILGPMLNPAGAAYGLVGVYSPDISELMGESLMRLGMRHALVVHSCGLDELTPMGPADVVEISPNAPLKRYSLDPKDVGIPRCEVADLAGGDAALNARILRDVFGGARGPVADALNLNAGYALAAAKVVPSPIEGVALAQEVQRAGKAAGTLDKWIAVSQEALQQEGVAAQQLTTAAA
ncbi:anthranilate phosphoribosyltransferase [Scenedesmus sp. NREL 46B-D3]|nr:anthranilate phosphoribosyltransferase [Scenedesmus sp. NREL 46B-D3]